MRATDDSVDAPLCWKEEKSDKSVFIYFNMRIKKKKSRKKNWAFILKLVDVTSGLNQYKIVWKRERKL